VTLDGPLRFIRNGTNTPVYILATGDVIVRANIDVSGQPNNGLRGGDSGPGGFAGGQGGLTPSNGFGPGGGKGGYLSGESSPPGSKFRRGGAFATIGNVPATDTQYVSPAPTYGNSLLIPLIGGSGGGGGTSQDPSRYFGGAGGGGAILIASNTRILFEFNNAALNGGVSARGTQATNGGGGGGSGGAIRLVAPTVESSLGAVPLSVKADDANTAGYGRIRIDSLQGRFDLRGEANDLSPSYATYGANMVVFPPNLPEIRITQAAGTNIALTQTDPVFVLLPSGAPATQTVQVQVKNFGTNVPLTAVVTPEIGDRTTHDFEVNNTGGGATTGSVQVQIPAGVSCRIDVWTR
jgi:hypothetical protein